MSLSATLAPGAARLEHVDALRGFALGGALLVNLFDLSLFKFLDPNARLMLQTARWDKIIEPFVDLFVTHKAATVFTLLFGVSFALQLQRSSVDGRGSFSGIYARRLLLLLAIGVLHGFLWYGDVLRYYAVAGLFLLLTRRLPPIILASIGMVIALFPWRALSHSSAYFSGSPAAVEQMIAVTLNAFTGPSFAEMVKANISYDWWFRRIEWTFPIAVLGRILIGAALGRSAALIQPQKHWRFWRWVAAIVLPIGIALTLVNLNTKISSELIAQTIRNAGAIAMALGYLALFLLCFACSPAAHRFLCGLCAVGQMTLTNYLLQTAVCLSLFYGVGLGIGPRFGLAGIVVFFLIIFAGQIFLSHWWLAYFRFGPVEWVWRCLSYGLRIPIRSHSHHRRFSSSR